MVFRIYNLSSQLLSIYFPKNEVFRRSYCKNKSYKVLFFGSDSIALTSLKKINELRKTEKIICKLNLVTANTSKKSTQIENYANLESIDKLSWPIQNIAPSEYDVGLIVAFGHLITKDVLEKFPLGMINIHPSLLPRWRGAAPIIHTLLHGDKVTGVTLMKIEADKFDVGEIISQQRVTITDDIRQPELTAQLSEIGANMLADCIKNLPKSLEQTMPQSEEGVTYAKKINKHISEVRWAEMTSIQVYNLYRAIYGIYHLTSKFRDKQIKLFDAFLMEHDTSKVNKQAGTLEYCDRTSAIKVLCKDRKYIYFRSIRIVGKRKITALDFYNGYIKNINCEKERQYVLC